MAIGGSSKRTRHTVYFVIGILTSHRGHGVGTHLFKHLEKWAVQHNIRRLELTVAQTNEAGMRLYRKMNFEIEGKIVIHSL
ncbi:N-acetyltransferase family protein [Sporosarcina sp. BI001-red]|uniref:GNAT family N-acetyltransferase n=1 Tax=Sporosarcina sp. BI001-red TaxID=2282866 RepID=UPI0026C0109B